MNAVINEITVRAWQLAALAVYSWVILTIFDAKTPRWADYAAGACALAITMSALA